MSKVDDKVELAEVRDIKDLAESVIFQPTPVHRKMKTKFWARYVPSPMHSIEDITLTDVVELTKDSRVRKLWAQPGFRDWFLNRDENRERLEYLFTLALDTAEEVLISEEVQASAKVNMIKVLGELANKFPNKHQQDRFVDEEINRMNELQLLAWLERRGVSPARLGSAEGVIDVTASEQEAGQAEQSSKPDSNSGKSV